MPQAHASPSFFLTLGKEWQEFVFHEKREGFLLNFPPRNVGKVEIGPPG